MTMLPDLSTHDLASADLATTDLATTDPATDLASVDAARVDLASADMAMQRTEKASGGCDLGGRAPLPGSFVLLLFVALVWRSRRRTSR